MDRFILKSWSIGLEVPFFDMNDQTGVSELGSSISDKYRNWFDTLQSNITVLKLPNTNQLILYSIIVRIDLDLVNMDTFESEWGEMRVGIEETFVEFMKVRNQEYRIVKE